MESKAGADLRYPIGKFDGDVDVNADLVKRSIDVLTELPQKIAGAVNGLDDSQLDTPYRPGGWSLRQTVHHVADSHLNAYCRFKLALTEDTPTIRPYFEDRWATLADSQLPVDISIRLIEAVHARWVALLRSLNDEDLRRKLDHPESGQWELRKMLAMYAWHSNHHTAHITTLRESKGW
jgi:uncharacterized damage-inducible protein DinB